MKLLYVEKAQKNNYQPLNEEFISINNIMLRSPSGCRKSTDFAILYLKKFTKNWISTDNFFFKCYKMEFNRFDVFWN